MAIDVCGRRLSVPVAWRLRRVSSAAVMSLSRRSRIDCPARSANAQSGRTGRETASAAMHAPRRTEDRRGRGREPELQLVPRQAVAAQARSLELTPERDTVDDRLLRMALEPAVDAEVGEGEQHLAGRRRGVVERPTQSPTFRMCAPSRCATGNAPWPSATLRVTACWPRPPPPATGRASA